MLMSELDVVNFIKQAKSVIIYGDTEGRKLARDLIDIEFPSKYVFDTRRYHHGMQYFYDLRKTILVPLFNYFHVGKFVTNKRKVKELFDALKPFKTKTRMIVVDSFTDVYKLLLHEQVEKAYPKRQQIDFKKVEDNIFDVYKILRSRKKKVVLFCDKKVDSLEQKIKMAVWWRLTLTVDGIIHFKDNQIILEKDRIGFSIVALTNLYKKAKENTEKGCKIVEKISSNIDIKKVKHLDTDSVIL